MIEGNLKALVLFEARDLLFACKISTKHDKCHHQDPKLFSSQVRDIFFWEGEEPVFSGQVTQYVESNSLPPLSKTHGEGNGTPLQYSCLENPMDGGAWWAAVHGVAKNRTQLNDFPFTFHFHALEKGMATHSSVLAWRIPRTGEPGGLPSVGSHRVRHDWSNLAAAAIRPNWIHQTSVLSY